MWFILLAAFVSAGYAAWHYGYFGLAGQKIAGSYQSYAPSWLPGSGAGGSPDSSQPGMPSLAVVGQDDETAQSDSQSGGLSLAIPDQVAAAQTLQQPLPAPGGALSVEAASYSQPAAQSPVSSASASSRQDSTDSLMNLRPDSGRNSAMPAAQPSMPAAPAGQLAAQPAVASAPVAPTPVLSDAKAQIKYIDQILRSNPTEALQKLETMTTTVAMQPDESADVFYRIGYAARLARDEAKAEKSWQEAAQKYPATRGGRYSALALGDTWYHQYASERPQMSRWDDIQLMYSQVLGQDDAPFLTPDVKARVKSNINKLNDALFFGGAPSKMARYHRVESGELLGGIAKIYRVDYESLARINGVNPNRIRVGMDLKVVVGDVEIVVRKNSKDPQKTPTLTWFIDGRWVREYPTCVGDGDKTPAGTYNLVSKERDPSWTNPANGQLLPNDHPENILGSHWMAMKGMNTQGLGIHGTTVDDSIPGYTSAGCIRLLNRDVEELFSFARIGAKVTVLE